MVKRGPRHTPWMIKHGMGAVGKRTPENRAWLHLRSRCNTPTDAFYADYGGRGIKVCDRWRRDLRAFLADMGPRPSPGYSIDRWPDNDGNYEPENCRWADKYEQARNKRNSLKIEHAGRRLSLVEWSQETGIPYMTLYSRYRRGKTGDQIFVGRYA